MPPLIEVRGIGKRFPGVVALDDVSFDLEPGEVHVLLGENGAGKSTLIKCLAGVYSPDSGEIRIDGQAVRLRDAADASRRGIATIHQEFNLVPHLTVAENVVLGRQPRRFGIINAKAAQERASRALAKVGLDLPRNTLVKDLGVGRQQMVEIAKALSQDARVLILDEPTAALADDEVDRLLALMVQLRQAGVAMIFISHHLDEIARIGDRVTVLRDGRSVGTVPATTPQDELIRLMVGRTIDAQYPRSAPVPGDVLLEVQGLSASGRFDDIDLVVRAGEVVGLAGLVGAGRTEVLRAIAGADRYDAGTVTVKGVSVRGNDADAAISAGLGLVPEDRKHQGLVLGASVQENLAMVVMRTTTRWGLVTFSRLKALAATMVSDLGIRTPHLGTTVANLSGGNQQKVVIGKWLAADPSVLLLDEPTRGIDVGAKVEIYQLMNTLTAQGRGVLMASSELPEVLGICDRILVMAHGRIVGEVNRKNATQDAIMALAVTKVESSRAI